jgi:FtsP/CotA-like multicopper oxidase with cupredoxin domain
MPRRKFPTLLTLILTLLALTWGSGQANGVKPPKKYKGKITHVEKEQAAKRARALGLKPGAAALPAPVPDPGGVPHYFGPYGNWAYSPLPKGAVTVLTVTGGGAGYNNPVVTIEDAYATGSGASASAVLGDGVIVGFTNIIPGAGYSVPLVTITDPTGSGADVSAIADVSGAILGFTINSGGTGYSAPTVTIVDDPALCVVNPPCGSGASASAVIGNAAITGFTSLFGGADYSAPIVTITDNPALCGGASQPACGTGATADATIGGTLTGGIHKFADRLPGLGPGGANNLVTPNRLGDGPASADGQYIPVAVPEPVTFSGQAADYYVIALVEFNEKMHSDLPPTRHRGYVQLETATNNLLSNHVPLTDLNGAPINYPGGGPQVLAFDYPHFLGPAIVAVRDKPVRIKFYNLLPTGSGGDLFLPVDETVAGSGLGPALPGTAGQKYTQNRAAVHLHGNNTVWISDGTPHQWITPAGENTPYPKGVSVRNVPDMPDPGPGAMTIFYTNAMSARLMFYHDHAMGITRLNVYGGEAAGYVLTDAVEQDMINGSNLTGVNPGFKKVLPDIGIPLVIQDRTFVDATTIFAQDPTWKWGTGTTPLLPNTGDLWVPHVYMSAQNPWDLSGVNAFGRWHFGPWFNPPVPECVNGLPVGCIEMGPVPNPYHQPDCDLDPPGAGCTAPWESPLTPGTPNPSIPGEAFNDTPIVNGTAYPYLEVEPKAYRFRVLNAANDRFLNLQLYVAADKTTPTTPGTTGTVLCNSAPDPTVCTEVKMIPVGGAPNQTADIPSGIPDPTTAGPNWIQIGTEGGFLPAPAVVPQQPIGWNTDPTAFNVGNVNQHSLLLGTAERADVVVDFSAFAGKTLILYNDAPAAFPAGVPTYDYYTGVANQMDVGGAPTTQPGYGPNTRTIMQIRVTLPLTTSTPDVTLANLKTVFAKTATKRGVFESSQDPIIIPQAAYNSAYNKSFTNTAAGQFLQVSDTQKTFQPINTDGVLQPAVTIPLEMKAMHDEMGGVYDTMFGRMSGMLGLSNPTSPVHVLIPYGYASPPTDVIKTTSDVQTTQIGSLPDGTQIWRIFHNGVDTHTIHTHLFTSQLINRIGQDGIMQAQEPSELGFKDTFRINPLEITFLAMRPILPTPAQLPFEVPDSVRLIDPTLPEGATLIPPAPAGWFDPDGVQIPEILNHNVNFGWEYVWHCHILAHEEMDMMHSTVAAVAPRAPTGPPTALAGLVEIVTGTANNPRVNLSWQDNSAKEARFRIERASDSNFTTGLTAFTYVNPVATVPNTVTYQDATVKKDSIYWYRVIAQGNPVGDTSVYPGSLGFPTKSADSLPLTTAGNVPIVVGAAPGSPTAPSNLTASLQAGPKASLTWTDNATNETGFLVERCTGAACANFAQIAVAGPRNNTGNVTYVDATVKAGNTYLYRVAAVNGAGPSAYFPIPPAEVSVTVPSIPAAPTSFTVAVVKASGNNYTATLNWAAAVNPGNFTIQRATNATFTTGLATSTAAGSARTLTQTVNRNTTYYYRIRANDPISGSSAWKNALPFPIRTGN